ncbi:MAG: Fic family protein [Bacteroidales bacterium]|nr:Fic family protein [Bacteroidales bacterium]
MYIHELKNWTDFRWSAEAIALPLDEVCREQGKLAGRLSGLGFDSQLRAVAENLTRDVVYSSEIEGIRLNVDEVRSSIARRLGIEGMKYTPSSHYVEGVVAVMLDAMEHFDQPLTKERLCGWQSAFFPSGFSEGAHIEVGQYRTHEEHVVSGFLGHERVHYMAPSPDRVEEEMHKFIDWFNADKPISPVIRSAIVHLWFVSIHPFEDGNGRLARILGDMYLARGDNSRLRFYNISSEINRDKNHYYDILERVQHGDGDITEWVVWYLKTLLAAIREASATVSMVLNKSFFWMRFGSVPLTERQTNTLNLFLDGYEAKITSKTWSNLSKCSKDTAIRDIQDLVEKHILVEDVPGAKRPSYYINYGGETDAIVKRFNDIAIQEETGGFYLTAVLDGKTKIKERLLALDAERYRNSDLPLENLLAKYCTYLLK